MDRPFLLTYVRGTSHQYEWFESEEEMQEFVDSNVIDEIIDSLEVMGTKEIKINFNR